MAPLLVFISAAIVFPVLFFVPAPYGRHLRQGWGPLLPARLGWVVMESVSLVLFGWAFWAYCPSRDQWSTQLLAALWLAHYAQRTIVFPLLMRGAGKRKPVLTVLMAIAFNAVNAVSNGAGLVPRAADAAFLSGVAIFLAGAVINLHADAVLRSLRKPGEGGYSIPRGGLYRWVSCPNYLGEMLEWIGFAIAARTLPAAAFAAFTFANLFPRAVAHHRWYRAQFPDYPAERKAIVPFLI